MSRASPAGNGAGQGLMSSAHVVVEPVGSTAPASPWRWRLGAAAIAVLAAVAWTWPLATALRSAIPTYGWHCLGNGCEDEVLCYWIVTALGQRLAEAPLALFEGGILLPLRHTLAFSETMLSAVALTAPFTWLTGEDILAYNLHYLSTVALSVLGTYLVVRDATGDPRAALVAGLLFGFAGERWSARGHLPRQAVQWVPFVCWTWMRFVDRPSTSRAVGLAAATLANLHTSVYQGLALPVLLVPWAGVLALSRHLPLRRWVAGGAIIAAAMAVGGILYWPLAVVREEQSFVSTGLAEVSGGWTWYTAPFLHPITYLARLAEPGRTISAMSPLPILALVVAGIVARARRTDVAAPAVERAHLLAALAFMAFTAATTVVEERLGPFAPAMHAIFALPGLDGLRGRGRFALLVSFGGALVLGIALATVLRRVRRRRVAAAVVAVAVLLVIVDTRTLRESTPLTWLPRDVPPAVELAARSTPNGGLLHLPYGHWSSETLYMIWALHHRHPIMNGFTAIMPRFGPLVRSFPQPVTLRALAEIGVTHVLLHPRAMIGGFGARMVQQIRETPGLSSVMLDGTMLVTLPPTPPPHASPAAGRPLPRDGWRLEGSDPDAARAADGDLATHWTAATFDRPTYLRVDLGAERRVTGVRLQLAMHLREFPHAWEAWGSRDGAAWERLGGEPLTPPPFASYERDHRAIEIDLPFPPASVRLLEIRVPPENPFVVFDGHSTGVWGVHELEVLGD
jgi:hypothetical protein